MRMPCQTITIVGEGQEEPVPEAKELRLVHRQQVADRLLHGRQKIQRRLRLHVGPRSWLRLTPCPKGVSSSCDERLVRCSSVSPGDELHVDRGSFRIARPFAVDEQLFDDAGQ